MSVERILEYKGLQPELQPAQPLNPDKTWPDYGNIEINNLVMRYNDDGPKVLKNVTVKIHSKEKVDII